VRTGPGFEQRAQAQGIDLSLLWVALSDGTIEGAALLVPHPGRSALLLATSPHDHAHAAAVGRLVEHVLREAAGLPGIRLVQALSAPSEALRSKAWAIGGLRHLASLDYMERPLQAVPIPETPATVDIRFEPWAPAERKGLEALLARTYVETLDCPGLAEMRTPEDIVDGHLAAGEHDPSLWTLAVKDGHPVGALLLSPSAATESVEVVYLGLAPEARGKGLGRALLSHGMQLVRHRNEHVLALAVDQRNTPAVALYARLGFRTVRRREAFVAQPAAYTDRAQGVK
jgi:GNAT superfamily N-acetyltransferase